MAKSVFVTLAVPAAAEGQRLDRFLKTARKDLPFALVQKLARTGVICVDGKRAKPDQRLLAGQMLTLPPAQSPAPLTSRPLVLGEEEKNKINNMVVYEDELMLVINKPAGLPAQGGNGIVRSVDRLLAAHYGEGNAPKLTHRIDRDTTGLLVLAKTRAAAAHITKQFADRKVGKVYLALLSAIPEQAEGDIRAPLAKQAARGGSRAVVHGEGDFAHTAYKVVKRLEGNLALVEATPHTGRMNQLRAHFAHIGCPLVGDGKYGGKTCKDIAKKLGAGREIPLYLHAWKLALEHPESGKALRLTAPLPAHFKALT
ncbi:MAG: RluA family pseudouridine synthase [Pseudomonadaceae bacterium]|nr:RluA family pseudouridine synthase [Pseudomonadaceae bacterium]